MSTNPVQPQPDDRRLAAPRRVIAFVNRTHGTDFTLDRRLPGGHQSGAYLLHSATGRAAVLKWSTDKSWARQVSRAEPVVDAARAAGRPTPAWSHTGRTPSGYPYQVQEHATGHRPARVTRKLVLAALPVLDVQAGLRPDTEQDWSAYDHALVFGTDTADFGGAIRAWAAPHRRVELPTTDLVHGDLNPDNVLLDGDRITALIDVEAVGRGSRMHDLATLLVYATLWDGEPGADDDLLAYARRHAAPGEFEISLAACLLDVLAFLVRHHPDDVDRQVGAATELLRRLP